MIEATEKIGVGGGNLREGSGLKIPEIKEKQGAFLSQGHHGSDVFVVGNVPGGEREMGKRAAFILPHELNFRSRWGSIAACSRKGVAQTGGQLKARAVRDMHLGKGRKETLVPHIVDAVGPVGKVALMFNENEAGRACRANVLTRLASQVYVKVISKFRFLDAA